MTMRARVESPAGRRLPPPHCLRITATRAHAPAVLQWLKEQGADLREVHLAPEQSTFVAQAAHDRTVDWEAALRQATGGAVQVLAQPAGSAAVGAEPGAWYRVG